MRIGILGDWGKRGPVGGVEEASTRIFIRQ